MLIVRGTSPSVQFTQLQEFEPVPLTSGLTNSTLGLNTLYFVPFNLDNPLFALRMNFFMSVATTWSALNSTATEGFTLSACMYQRGTGTGSQQMNSFWSGSMFVSVSNSSNSAATLVYPVGISNSTALSTVSSTYATASFSNTVLSSLIAGYHEVYLPVSSTLAPGRYWVAVAFSTGAATVGSFGLQASILQQTQAYAPLYYVPGFNLSAASNAGLPVVPVGSYSATSGAFPANVPLSSSGYFVISANQTIPYMNFSGYAITSNML